MQICRTGEDGPKQQLQPTMENKVTSSNRCAMPTVENRGNSTRGQDSSKEGTVQLYEGMISNLGNQWKQYMKETTSVPSDYANCGTKCNKCTCI